MTGRRTFFKRLASVVACVALAPEIAFRAKLELPTHEDYKPCIKGIIEQFQECKHLPEVQLDWREISELCYKIKRNRETDALNEFLNPKGL